MCVCVCVCMCVCVCVCVHNSEKKSFLLKLLPGQNLVVMASGLLCNYDDHELRQHIRLASIWDLAVLQGQRVYYKNSRYLQLLLDISTPEDVYYIVLLDSPRIHNIFVIMPLWITMAMILLSMVLVCSCCIYFVKLLNPVIGFGY